MARPIIHCQIEEIAEWHPHLFVEPHIVACVAILSQYSACPAKMEVECQRISRKRSGKQSHVLLELSWTDVTGVNAERIQSTIQSEGHRAIFSKHEFQGV